MQLDVEQGAKGLEKLGGEFRSMITGNVEGNAMLSEYMMEEEFGDSGGVDFVMCRDADELLAGTVDNIEDGSMIVGGRELFDEVEGDGMPRTGRNGELLDEAEGFVLRGLVSFAGDTAVDKILDVSADVGPHVVSLEEVEHVVLAGVSCSWVVVLEL